MRSRNIKPGFFHNELMVEFPYEVRLLFIGLWTIADKSGRLENRPKKIKMEIFPADDVDVTVGLRLLNGAGFVTLYSVDNQELIQIVNWDKHQSPHHTEKDSTLPPLVNGYLTVDSRNHLRGNPPDSLIPDSLIPDSKTLCTIAEKAPRLVPKENESSKKKNGNHYPVELDPVGIQWSGISNEDAEVWEEAFPAVNVHAELMKAASWAVANPAQKKKNWKRFIFNWLARAQERGSYQRISK